MGLDMYLKARKYISGWNHNKEGEKFLFAKTLKVAGLTMKDVAEGSPSGYLEINVGYWRKANAIHGWFVKNVQDGKDECVAHHVSREQLQALLDDVNFVLENKGGNKTSVLQPVGGFFFGSTAIDEWYWEDMKYTQKLLKKILENPRLEDWEFEYRSSW